MNSILFSAPMVRANIAGIKNQTRRVIPDLLDHTHKKQDPINGNPSDLPWPHVYDFKESTWKKLPCKYGKRGDYLFVKETFAKNPEDNSIIYRADPGAGIGCHKWTPAIFMPEASSRLTLRIEEIRFQRIQDITEEDAAAEGLYHVGYSKLAKLKIWSINPLADPKKHCTPESETYDSARMCYSDLWNSINLKPSPVYGPRDKSTGKRPIIHYVSYPWSLDDFRKAYPKIEDLISPTWRGKPLHIHNNPYVWAITYAIA